MCVLCVVCVCACVCVLWGCICAQIGASLIDVQCAAAVSILSAAVVHMDSPLDHKAKIDVWLQVAKVHSAVKVGPKIVEEMVTWAHGVGEGARGESTNIVSLWRGGLVLGWKVG